MEIQTFVNGDQRVLIARGEMRIVAIQTSGYPPTGCTLGLNNHEVDLSLAELRELVAFMHQVG